jgi:uncharacterized HhH-GPD family protein
MHLYLSQRAEADELLAKEPLALLIGMLLDQQFPLERAFAAPYELRQRLGRDLDVHELAEYDPDALAAVFAKPPALHRFPRSMARRVQELCQLLVDRYGGDPAAIWRTATSGEELRQRAVALPGFGEQKARILVALLGKQFGVTPQGWREAAGPFGAEGSRLSVADITDQRSLAEVRAYKQQLKQAKERVASGDKPGKSDAETGVSGRPGRRRSAT